MLDPCDANSASIDDRADNDSRICHDTEVSTVSTADGEPAETGEEELSRFHDF